MTTKRSLILAFIFLAYPIWHFVIRVAYLLDNLFYPEYRQQIVEKPIFIVGNFRSGSTFLHRLLTKDEQFTGLKSWEIYLAPSIVQRKLLRMTMRLNYLVGNPVQRLIEAFEKALSNYSYMHKTGLNEVEEDGQVMFHIWSTYNLLAFFPFPKLVRKYIYYDRDMPDEGKQNDMKYYHEVLQRHVFAHQGKRYIAKSPTYSPKVRTLHEKFPDAKFINLVRTPLRVIPSSISMFSNHWKTYGDPESEYPPMVGETIIEHSKHWYLYPHQYLKQLPSDQYILIRFKEFVRDPKKCVERIYQQFDLQMSAAYAQILAHESEKAKQHKSGHQYSLRDMGIEESRLVREFSTTTKIYDLEDTL